MSRSMETGNLLPTGGAKVLVTGPDGRIGREVMVALHRRGFQAVGIGRREMDITDAGVVARTMDRERPEVVIHCAAWTAVDWAELAENRSEVRRVNADGTEHVAIACRALGCKMLYLSTDYVFDGQGFQPWSPDDEQRPVNFYGQTKYEGELAVAAHLDRYFIVRTAWIFGAYGTNFVKTILREKVAGRALEVVSDQVGTPTYAYDLARLVVDMVMTEQYGCYHATNEGGFLSWYEFAQAIFERVDYPATGLRPTTTAVYDRGRAVRPLNGRLDKKKLVEKGFLPLPSWQDALDRYLARPDNGI